jgi:hypothetical protein
MVMGDAYSLWSVIKRTITSTSSQKGTPSCDIGPIHTVHFGKVFDLAVTTSVAPISRVCGYPLEMAVIHCTTQTTSFTKQALRLHPKAQFPCFSHAMSGIGPAVRNGVFSKPAFAVWPLVFNREHERGLDKRLLSGLCSGATQAGVTYQNKLFTLLRQGGVQPSSMHPVYTRSFAARTVPAYLSFMCFSNLLTIEAFYIAKEYLKKYYPNKSEFEYTVSATCIGLLPASAVLTVPERSINILLQRQLTQSFSGMNQGSLGITLPLRQYCFAVALRTLWKGVENGIMIGGSLMIKNTFFSQGQPQAKETALGPPPPCY